MKKKFTLLILFSTLLTTANSQAQQGTTPSGGTVSGSGGTVSYSIGQIDYTTIAGTGGTASQGIQQPYEIFVLGRDDFQSLKLSIIAYPNPTVSVLNLTFESLDVKQPRFELYDLNGKLLHQQMVTSIETRIAMEHLPATMYLLKVYAGTAELKVFKILKRN